MIFWTRWEAAAMLIPAADASFRRSMLLSAAKKKEPSPPQKTEQSSFWFLHGMFPTGLLLIGHTCHRIENGGGPRNIFFFWNSIWGCCQVCCFLIQVYGYIPNGPTSHWAYVSSGIKLLGAPQKKSFSNFFYDVSVQYAVSRHGGMPPHTCRKIRIWGSQLLLSLSLTSPGAIIDVAWQILWLKNDVFDEILGCVGHLTSPEKKWAPVAIKIFYKYVPPCQAVCCFPTQGLKCCGALHHFWSDDTYARWEIGRLGSNRYTIN